jgi:hypothetical protein
MDDYVLFKPGIAIFQGGEIKVSEVTILENLKEGDYYCCLHCQISRVLKRIF